MTFQPTKQQLEELGFKLMNYEFYSEYELYLNDCSITYSEDRKTVSINASDRWWHSGYPQSIDDLKTLIRILNPPPNN